MGESVRHRQSTARNATAPIATCDAVISMHTDTVRTRTQRQSARESGPFGTVRSDGSRLSVGTAFGYIDVGVCTRTHTWG
jgi:hypothetical protein